MKAMPWGAMSMTITWYYPINSIVVRKTTPDIIINNNEKQNE